MEQHKCKICLRSFTNGRALGGHMRSHIANKVDKSENQVEDIISYHSSSSSEAKENLDFQDEESETRCSEDLEDCINKRKNKEQEQISSVSETNPDEEMAYCLMMLKRDSWKRRENDEIKSNVKSKKLKQKQSVGTKVKAKYKCDTCGKVFKSYQALGGHRASHKKGLTSNKGLKIEEKESGERLGEKNHQCLICLKVFTSGQALGGHKRSHLSGLEANYNLVDSPDKKTKSLIDLNLPPVDDDDEDNEISQVVSQS